MKWASLKQNERFDLKLKISAFGKVSEIYFLTGGNIGIPHFDACDSLISFNWAMRTSLMTFGSWPVDAAKIARVTATWINLSMFIVISFLLFGILEIAFVAVDDSFNQFVSPFFASSSEYALTIETACNGTKTLSVFPLTINIVKWWPKPATKMILKPGQSAHCKNPPNKLPFTLLTRGYWCQCQGLPWISRKKSSF